MSDTQSILNRWKLTESELTQIINANPSLRGFMLGYVGEYKLRSLLHSDNRISHLKKPDDHDRRKSSKADLLLMYDGYPFSLEVKSLQTNSIKTILEGKKWTGTVQVDASDKRPVILSDGTNLETTCLLRGEFDILAVSLFQFREEWEFAFILNQDLPTSTSKKYTPFQQSQLLATSVRVSYPVEEPFVTDPFLLLNRLIQQRRNTTSS